MRQARLSGGDREIPRKEVPAGRKLFVRDSAPRNMSNAPEEVELNFNGECTPALSTLREMRGINVED